MLNVLYFSPSEAFPAPHAGFTHTYNVVRTLSKLGHKVVVVTKPPENYSKLTGIVNESYTLYYVKRKIAYSRPHHLANFVTYPLILSRIIEKHDLEIIHERFATPGGVGTMAAKISGVPCVLEINSPFMGGLRFYNKWIGWFDRLRQFTSCSAIVTQTNTLKKILLAKHAREPIYVVPNGVDPEFFNPNLNSDSSKKRYNIHNKKIILAVSSFRPWHGIEDLVLAASEVNKRRKDILFVLVGEGEQYLPVKQLIKRFSLEKKILLLGARAYSEIPLILSMADVFVAPFNPYSDLHNLPLYEKYGFFWSPVKIFEYMAMGKPIVTTQVGELSQYVGKAGLLVPPGDVKELASTILELLDNPEEMRERGELGRRRVLERYTWEKQMKKLVEIHQKLI